MGEVREVGSYLFCEHCRKAIAHLDPPVWVRECPHFKWSVWGNKCYEHAPCGVCELGFNPDPCRWKKLSAVYVLRNGLTVYTLHRK